MRSNRARAGKVDFSFLIIVLMLVIYGLIMVFSASSASAHHYQGDTLYFIKRQLIWAVLGVIAMIVISNIPYKVVKKLAVPIFIISVVCLVLVPLVGKEINGAKRWLGFGSLGFQPSELAKFAMIIFLSKLLSENKFDLNDYVKGFWAYLCIIGGIALIILISGAIVVALTSLVLLYMAGANMKHMLTLLPLGGVALAAAIIIEPYRMKRFITFLDPFADTLGDGWQVVQSLYAIGSGGLFGLGLGQSRQKFLYIPEPHNDFIFSIICEELGFVGAVFTILLFVMLIWRGIRISILAPDKFSSLLSGGIMSLVAIQVLMNIAVVTSSMPATGVPLPFFSYGGTSLLFMLASMGVMLNISRYSARNTNRK